MHFIFRNTAINRAGSLNISAATAICELIFKVAQHIGFCGGNHGGSWGNYCFAESSLFGRVKKNIAKFISCMVLTVITPHNPSGLF